MKKNEAAILLHQKFNFLSNNNDFQLKIIESKNYLLYALFESKQVGIYFTFEFRDSIPRIQISMDDSYKVKVRPGLYTLMDMYKDPRFCLRSFYLDEIISFKNLSAYSSYFVDVTTIEDCIDVSAYLLKSYAIEFVNGDTNAYADVDRWYKQQIELHTKK